MSQKSLLIVGSGPGLSSSLARIFHAKGMKIGLAARNTDKLNSLKTELDAEVFKCDSSDKKSVQNLFKETDKILGTPNIAVSYTHLRAHET